MKPPRGSTFTVLVIALSAVTGLLANSITGPSSSQSPYIVRSQPGVVVKAIMTVGDSVNLKPDGVTPYRMVGIADGLGAFDNQRRHVHASDEPRDHQYPWNDARPWQDRCLRLQVDHQQVRPERRVRQGFHWQHEQHLPEQQPSCRLARLTPASCRATRPPSPGCVPLTWAPPPPTSGLIQPPASPTGPTR